MAYQNRHPNITPNYNIPYATTSAPPPLLQDQAYRYPQIQPTQVFQNAYVHPPPTNDLYGLPSQGDPKYPARYDPPGYHTEGRHTPHFNDHRHSRVGLSQDRYHQRFSPQRSRSSELGHHRDSHHRYQDGPPRLSPRHSHESSYRSSRHRSLENSHSRSRYSPSGHRSPNRSHETGSRHSSHDRYYESDKHQRRSRSRSRPGSSRSCNEKSKLSNSAPFIQTPVEANKETNAETKHTAINSKSTPAGPEDDSRDRRSMSHQRSLTRSPSRDSRSYHRRYDDRRDAYRSRYTRSPDRSRYTRSPDRSRYTRSPERSHHSRSHDRASLAKSVDDLEKMSKHSEKDDENGEDLLSASEKIDISKIMKEFEEFELEQDRLEELESSLWVRCSPAEQYYQRSRKDPNVVVGVPKLHALHETFRKELLQRVIDAEKSKPPFELPPRKIRLKKMKSPGGKCKSESSSSCTDSDTSSSDTEEEDTALEELERKKKHPYRLHQELWYNDPGEMNDGPLCRCSAKAQRSGIRHGIYPGEEHLNPCELNSNNANKLHHYRVTMSPHTNFLSKFPTIIEHDGHEFIFEGFSMFSHASLSNLPPCRVIRFNIEYTVLYLEESFPENFTVECLDLFFHFLFHDILELVDLNWKAYNDPRGCQRFHFLPRFARNIEDGGKELLSMNVILQYLLNSNDSLIPDNQLETLTLMSQLQWQDWADKVKGMVVTTPGMKPCSLRVDQLDREQCAPGKDIYPEIVHFGIRPPQLSYAGNPSYQKAWRSYVKFRHLLANKPKVEFADRHKLLQKEMKLQEMRMKSNLKRDVTVVIGSKNFYRTGIMCDMVQHALLLPVLVCHLRLHQSLNILESCINHQFQDRWLLQLALTHPSYRENFGTNPDHARNSLTNCGIRQPEYGDRRIHYMNTRKRGINTLINIMSRFGKREETLSHINHNERLEFLGDAVVEFLSSIHLFFMFPDLEEGGLATYRAAIVQNQHLAVLAKKLHLEKYMLYAHGSDLCHDLELRHAMANCFEALMGALFLDGGITVADKVFSHTLFSEHDLLDVWCNYPPHPLQEQEPHGDRKWIESVPLLKDLHKFEEATGIEFTHIRLLARSFTHRSVGFNNLTLGSNQRLEFLGDTVLQLVASEYLYKFFPEHHEGHLSLLRSSLVNNRTQSVVCEDLGMAEYAIYPHPKGELKTKDKADLLEAFLGALYVDKGLDFCKTFCHVCFFPRLQPFIMNQDWNDPKSKLQQCCLTLRSMDGGEPDIPLYKVIECMGPTNTRVYTVAVYFRGERLATGSGHSIQQSEMAAAFNALDSSKHLFPQLNHQKRVIERSVKQQVPLKSSRTKKRSKKKKK